MRKITAANTTAINAMTSRVAASTDGTSPSPGVSSTPRAYRTQTTTLAAATGPTRTSMGTA